MALGGYTSYIHRYDGTSVLSPSASTIGRNPQREIYAITMNRTIKISFDEINYESVAISF